MSPAAGVVVQGDQVTAKPMAVPGLVRQSLMAPVASDAFAKDSIIAWFRGEFAAANAIIDALCGHLAELDSGAAEKYESSFAAIHRRRINWIQILRMQKFYSIADITVELKKVSDKEKQPENDVDGSAGACTETSCDREKQRENTVESSVKDIDNDGVVVDEDFTSEGSQAVKLLLPERPTLCSNHRECEARSAQIRMTKGYVAKEPVKGHMMNVLRGLKLYEDIFTKLELSKLNDLVNELRLAGQKGELSGDTFILYNQQTEGNKRELVQLGVPIFEKIKKDEMNKVETNEVLKSDIEPIPTLFQNVIEHLVQWRLIPENRKPNSCIINFFDEGEYSPPFMKPPHLEQPISTLLLSESMMAFGRMLVGDGKGNYQGSLVLPLKKGSLVVMRGNSLDTARHAMCSSLNKRVSVSFFRVRAEGQTNPSDTTAPLSKTITLRQPAVSPNGYAPMNMIPKWGLLRTPTVMLGPVRPLPVNPKRIPHGGTGVFLPWTIESRKHVKSLPPRAQRGRLLALRSPVSTASNSGVVNSP